MLRNETGLGLPQVSANDFMDVLWGADNLSDIRLSPDVTIDQIRQHVAAGALDAAASLIAAEIDRIGPIVTYARYLAPDERPPFLLDGRLLRYACDLNIRGATVAMRQARWQDAREYLLQAITAIPDSELPRAHFVELYVETRAFRAARELLALTVDSRRSYSAELFNLGVDLLERGEADEAAACFTLADARDATGGFGQMSALHRERVCHGDIAKPDTDALHRRVGRALELMQAGDPSAAQPLLLATLSWMPREGPLWHLLGLTYLLQAELAGVDLQHARELDDATLHRVEAARDAFALAVGYRPELIEAQTQLSNCLRALGQSDDARPGHAP